MATGYGGSGFFGVSAGGGATPLFTVTPTPQSVPSDCTASYTVALTSGVAPSGGYNFVITDDVADGIMQYGFPGASPLAPLSNGTVNFFIQAGASSAVFIASQQVPHASEARTVHMTVTPPSGLGGPAVGADVSFTALNFAVMPASQTGVVSTPATFTISLVSGTAPTGGYVFGLSKDSGTGTLSGTTATIAAGASSVTFTAQDSVAETLHVTIVPPSALGCNAVSVALVAGSAPPTTVGYTATPSTQTALIGVPTGNYTISLTGGASAPSGGYVFTLATSAASGGSFAPGTSVTMPAGYSAITFTYTGTLLETDTLTVTPDAAMSNTPLTVLAVIVAISTPSLPGLPTLDVDIRFYSSDGKRLNVPDTDSINFEIGEQGGMQNGSFQTLVPWEQLQFTGTEYVDVRLWGQFLYRGWIWEPQNELAGTGERCSPTLHGFMEFLNGFQCRRDFGYAPAVSPDVFFTDLLTSCVLRSDRLPATELDTTGVSALGLTMWGLSVKGKTVSQALNSLCELFPDQLIWGCDVNPASNANRIYLRPRAASVGYRYSVGKDVTAFVYPRDATKVVNRIYITGAKYDGTNGTDPNSANLLPNASFEDGAQNNEIDGNRLQNGDFEEIDTFGTVDAWNLSGASLSTGNGRSGNGIALNSAGNYLYQDIPLGGTPPAIHAACWWNAVQFAAWSYQFKFEIYDTSNTLIAHSYQTAQSVSGDPVGFTFLHVGYDWTPPSGLASVGYLRVIFELVSTAGNTVLDDASVWFDGAEQSKAWWASKSHLAGFASLDWRNRDFTPYDGDVMVKAQTVVQTGGYAEISTRHKDRPQGNPERSYFLGFWVYTPTGAGTLHCAPGARIVQSDTLKTTITGATQVATNGVWTHISTFFDPGANCDAIEPFLHFLDTGTYYVDAAGMWRDVTVSPEYVEADTYQAMRDTSMYTSMQIGAEAAGSLTKWNAREVSVTNTDIANDTDADAYAVAYFKANAVPSVQGKLTLFGANAPVRLDGQVKLLNLPDAPDALNPSRIHYTIGHTIDIEVDLEREKPILENLLRLVAAGRA